MWLHIQKGGNKNEKQEMQYMWQKTDKSREYYQRNGPNMLQEIRAQAWFREKDHCITYRNPSTNLTLAWDGKTAVSKEFHLRNLGTTLNTKKWHISNEPELQGSHICLQSYHLLHLCRFPTQWFPSKRFYEYLIKYYEYLIKYFADSAGKKGGEFYTPTGVVQLLVQLLAPQEGMIVYDPTAGSGGMLIQSQQYVDEHANFLG